MAPPSIPASPGPTRAIWSISVFLHFLAHQVSDTYSSHISPFSLLSAPSLPALFSAYSLAMLISLL